MALKIGIITTTIREGRAGLDVANWVLSSAKERNDQGVLYEIVDLKDYSLPVLGDQGATAEQNNAIGAWAAKMGEFDGFVFVTAEYNHAPSGAIKNALDYLKEEFYNKPAAFVGYGGLGASRAIEVMRIILAELQVATVQKTVNFTLAHDFLNYSKFAPTNYHGTSTNLLFDQLLAWAKALKTIR